jgi:hypothetical protein
LHAAAQRSHVSDHDLISSGKAGQDLGAACNVVDDADGDGHLLDLTIGDAIHEGAIAGYRLPERGRRNE